MGQQKFLEPKTLFQLKVRYSCAVLIPSFINLGLC